MKSDKFEWLSGILPITRSLRLEFIISVIISILMFTASIVGVLYSQMFYPDTNHSLGYIGTNLLNLVVGLPVLLATMWLARRGKLTGLLCWPGALFYVLYVYPTYLATSVNVLFIAYILLIILSAYTIISIIVSINHDAVRERLTGFIHAKTAGGILTGIAILIIGYQIVRIVTLIINRTMPDNLELIQLIFELVVACPALLIGGYMLFRGMSLGYVVGMGLLLICSMLFIGVIPAMILQAISANESVNVIGILIVLVSGMVCFIPFLLFLKGVAKSKK